MNGRLGVTAVHSSVVRVQMRDLLMRTRRIVLRTRTFRAVRNYAARKSLDCDRGCTWENERGVNALPSYVY